MPRIVGDPSWLLHMLIQNLRDITISLDTREFDGKEKILAKYYQQFGSGFSSFEMVNDALLLESLAQALNRSAKILRKIERNESV